MEPSMNSLVGLLTGARRWLHYVALGCIITDSEYAAVLQKDFGYISAHMSVHMSIRMCIRAYEHVYTHVHTNVCAHAHAHVYAHIIRTESIYGLYTCLHMFYTQMPRADFGNRRQHLDVANRSHQKVCALTTINSILYH